MAAGKIQFIECQSLLIGRNRAYRVQGSRILLKAAAVLWMQFPKDTVLLTSALLTLPQLLKLFRAAAETKHRRGGILLLQANISVGKERLCTPEKFEYVYLRRSKATNQNCVNTSANCWNCTGTGAGLLRPNARRSGEANEEDRHIQTRVGDRGLFLFVRRRSLYVLDCI